MKVRILAVILLIAGITAGYFVYPFAGISEKINVPFRLGLDLVGGIHLLYRADLSEIPDNQKSEALEGLRDIIERRVNFFGVSEPVVRTNQVLGEERLVVDLAGIFDTQQAINLIGETPYLDFREQNEASTSTVSFVPTELTGRFLDRAALQFDQTTGKPYVELFFDEEGARLFEEITERNVGKQVAIYLDGFPISIPVVQGVISGGRASITGDFEAQEANLLVQRLNSGALPVPIELISQGSVEATRGTESLQKSFFAGLIGFLLVVVFMVAWYRLPGLVAVVALLIYVSLTLAVFKVIPVTFSTAAIAGFVLSLGMAVDANILIFERIKEELNRGKSISGAIEDGFIRAWSAVRDSNISSLITALILWYFGTDAVKGFALTLGLGVVISMFSAIVVSRTFLRAVHTRHHPLTKTARFLYGSGISNVKS